MKILQYKELTAWNERFCTFNDAVLRSWSLKFESTTTIVEIVIEAQDLKSPSGWSFVTIRLSDVSSLKLCHGPDMNYQVLSNGLHSLFYSDRVALEFGYFIDPPNSFSELTSSPCHVVARILEWEARHYPK
jgi:hypothetical protein